MDDSAPTTPPPTLFQLVGRSRDGDYWVDVSGELDLATDADLREALAAVEPHPEGRVLLSLRDLDFVDADSLVQLLDFVRSTRQAGRSVGVQGARGVVRRMADLLGFEAELAVV